MTVYQAMAMIGIAAAVAAAATCAGPERSTPGPTGFLFGSLSEGGRDYPYAVYVPRNYDPARGWPLVVALHGSGESGTDGAKQIVQGIGSAILWDAPSWPCLVLFPQKPTEDSEWEQHEAAVMAMLSRVRGDYRVDAARIYLTGLSQGGHGAWVLGARHAAVWAAVVPICGYGPARSEGPGLPPTFRGTPAELAAKLARLPIWAFHGESDDVVPVEAAREMAAALRDAGGAPKLTVLPGVGHNAWDAAYRDPALRKWLLAQRR
jgi:predicted peptidase